jgi:tRNA pseudouridine(55) synthase
MSFAGRLDPMAHGLMILLIGDECKLQDQYICKWKTYKSKILLDVTTDTFDILGIPTLSNHSNILPNENDINSCIQSFVGSSRQQFPNYSSICVKSDITGERMPLWKWTKENKLDFINIPDKEITINHIHIHDITSISSNDLLDIIESNINKLSDDADFRQKEILDKWNILLKDNNKIWTIIDIESLVSSGTYIRSLSNEIGTLLNTGGIALDINRVKIDDIDKTNFII